MLAVGLVAGIEVAACAHGIGAGAVAFLMQVKAVFGIGLEPAHHA